MYFKKSAQGISINLLVSAGAKKSILLGLHADRLKIKIQAPPVDGKANQEIIRFFSELTGLPKNQIHLNQGEKSRQKTIFLQGLEELPAALTFR